MRLLLLSLLAASSVPAADPIHVLVWDERQPRQSEAYDNFLGNEIAAYLRKQPGLAVRSMKLNDAEQGLSDAILDGCQAQNGGE